MSAFFVEMVDNTLPSIALPTIGRDLGSGTAALEWVAGAYSLTFGGLLLTAGSVADGLGGDGCCWSAWLCSAC